MNSFSFLVIFNDIIVIGKVLWKFWLNDFNNFVYLINYGSDNVYFLVWVLRGVIFGSDLIILICVVKVFFFFEIKSDLLDFN